MAQKDRYRISWEKPNKEWEDVTAKTKNEGIELYNMLEKGEYLFKVLYDIVSGEQLCQDEGYEVQW